MMYAATATARTASILLAIAERAGIDRPSNRRYLNRSHRKHQQQQTGGRHVRRLRPVSLLQHGLATATALAAAPDLRQSQLLLLKCKHNPELRQFDLKMQGLRMCEERMGRWSA